MTKLEILTQKTFLEGYPEVIILHILREYALAKKDTKIKLYNGPLGLFSFLGAEMKNLFWYPVMVERDFNHYFEYLTQ